MSQLAEWTDLLRSKGGPGHRPIERATQHRSFGVGQPWVDGSAPEVAVKALGSAAGVGVDPLVVGEVAGDQPIHQFLNLSSFAELMLIHEHALVKIREDMPMDRAALIGCSTTTGVGAVFHTAGVEPGSTVAVLGCGGVGLAAINGAAIAGAGMIIAVDMLDSKLEIAKSLGATHTVNASSGNAVGEVIELTKGGCDYTFEAIGLKATAEQAFQMLCNGGTATVIGMIPVGTMVELHGVDFLMEKKMQGSNMGSNRFRIDMPRFVDFYLSGKLHLDQMISKHIKLSDVNEALDALKTGQEARHVIMFDQ